MAHIPERFLIHSSRIKDLTGAGAMGSVWSERSSPTPCLRSEKRRMVRDASGEEVVSEVTLIMALNTGPVPGSQVFLESRGEWANVIALSHHDDGDMGAWQHDEVNLA